MTLNFCLESKLFGSFRAQKLYELVYELVRSFVRARMSEEHVSRTTPFLLKTFYGLYNILKALKTAKLQLQTRPTFTAIALLYTWKKSKPQFINNFKFFFVKIGRVGGGVGARSCRTWPTSRPAQLNNATHLAAPGKNRNLDLETFLSKSEG